MIEYMIQSRQGLLTALVEHIGLTLWSLFWAIAMASLLTLLFIYYPNLKKVTTYLLSILYAIPSFAFFGLLLPVTGLGQATAIIVLALYAQFILVRNIDAGLTEIDDSIMEAATGMGMTQFQLLTQVQLPLAKRAIFSGIQLAANAIVAIATIAAVINAGGLGTIIFDGLRTMRMEKMLSGILITVAWSLVLNGMIYLVEQIFSNDRLNH